MTAKTKAARRSGNYDTRQVCTAHRPSQQRKYTTVKPLRSYRPFDEARAEAERMRRGGWCFALAWGLAVAAMVALMALFGIGC